MIDIFYVYIYHHHGVRDLECTSVFLSFRIFLQWSGI